MPHQSSRQRLIESLAQLPGVPETWNSTSDAPFGQKPGFERTSFARSFMGEPFGGRPRSAHSGRITHAPNVDAKDRLEVYFS